MAGDNININEEDDSNYSFQWDENSQLYYHARFLFFSIQNHSSFACSTNTRSLQLISSSISTQMVLYGLLIPPIFASAMAVYELMFRYAQFRFYFLLFLLFQYLDDAALVFIMIRKLAGITAAQMDFTTNLKMGIMCFLTPITRFFFFFFPHTILLR